MSLHVLIADHRMDQVMLLAEFLLRRGLHAATCMDGNQALEGIRSHCADGQPYDLVIAHVDLPGVAGLRVLYEARRLHLQTVVAVSCPRGRRDEQTEIMIRKTGVSAVLDQPFDLAQIDALVKKLLKVKPQDTEAASGAEAAAPVTTTRPSTPPVSAELPAINTGSEAPPVARPLTARSAKPEPARSPVARPLSAAEDVALPAMGSDANGETNDRRRSSDFYDPETGTLGQRIAPEAVPLSRRHQPQHRNGGSAPDAAQTGARRQRSEPVVPVAPALGGSGPPAEPGYTRRRSSEFFAGNSSKPPGTTKRIRRGVTGSFAPEVVAQRQATCGHCGALMTFRPNAGQTTLPCSACGQTIRLEN